MTLRFSFLLVLLNSVLLYGQFQVDAPNLVALPLFTGLNLHADDMAVDRDGNVYLLDRGSNGGLPTPPSVSLLSANAMVVPNWFTNFGNAGQLATHPLNGRVYLVTNSPFLPVILSQVWLLDANAGAVQVFSVDVVASGMTIDNQGRFWFGGTGIIGSGLHRVDTPVPGINTSTALGGGFGQNAMLLAMVDGPILIADGFNVVRWISPGVFVQPFFSHIPLPNTFFRIRSLARRPFENLGAGAVIGVDDFTTLCFCGSSTAVQGDLLTASNASICHENYALNARGLLALASGFRNDLYWYTNDGSPNTLYRIVEAPAVNSPGSLIASGVPGTLTLDLYGYPSIPAPYLLGAVFPAANAIESFVGPLGHLVHPLITPGYIMLQDGLGLFGPPNPAAVIPASGHATATFALPPFIGPLMLPVSFQFVALDARASNGVLLISNVENFVLP